ncbi:hypothetical protein LCGC14_2248510 [marine sediment metagenome]|uniref:DUF7007 domain-containing protein n=1 Tax=marine sediment metagenome TaxID=412755 RepID=A0A0F9D3I9_9ZZZZ
MRTPWGESDSVEVIAPGIAFYGTPSHGGFHIASNLLGRIRPIWQAYARKWSGSAQWYEEDCAAALVVIEFPEHFTDSQIEDATSTRKWLETTEEIRDTLRQVWTFDFP